MEKYLSDIARRIVPYTPGEQPKAGEKLIKLNTNENPYPPSPKVMEAIEQAMDRIRLYPDPKAVVLREAIAEAEGLAPENVFVGNGSDEVLAQCFPAFFAGRLLRFADITYSFYKVFAALYSVQYELVPLKDDFSLDVEGFLRPGAGGVLIANPNAPTGMNTGLYDIERILAANADCVVAVDEAYFYFGGQSAAPLIKRYPNLLVVRTLSKSHALAGMRVGYALGQRHLTDALERIKDSFNSYPLDTLAQAAAAAAIMDGGYYTCSRDKIIATRERFTKELSGMGFTVLPSKANFVFARPKDGDAAGLMKKLREKGILVRHFALPRVDEWLRISIGTNGEMDALIRALKG